MRRFSLLALLVVVALVVAGCGKAPDARIEQATAAFQAAEAAGAAEYAPDAWSRAKQAMDRMRAEVDAQGRRLGFLRNYGKAGTLAEEATRTAKQAAEEAGRKRGQLAGEITALIADVRKMLRSAEARLATLPRTRGLDPAALKSTLDMAGRQLDQAQADLDAGRLDNAMAVASQARDAIAQVFKDVERATGQPLSRKR
jgi:hypothetical protein